MSRTILIVEDNDDTRLMLRDILIYHGYEVLEAKTGVEGIDMARTSMPDLILMDIQMPVMDGFAACKILKEEPLTRLFRIIALTSFAMQGDRERTLEAGFDDYIAKPINTREFPFIIKSQLEKGRSDD